MRVQRSSRIAQLAQQWGKADTETATPDVKDCKSTVPLLSVSQQNRAKARHPRDSIRDMWKYCFGKARMWSSLMHSETERHPRYGAGGEWPMQASAMDHLENDPICLEGYTPGE